MRSEGPDEPIPRVLPRVLVVLVMILGTLAVYFPTLDYGFVGYDDPSYVVQNPHLKQGLTAESVRWAFTSVDYQYNWHPLTWLSHLLDVHLFSKQPGAHHRTNLVLHLMNGFLLLGALRALGLGFWRSVFVATAFLWHPLRVESVAWVSERKDLLAGFFWIAGVWAYANHRERPSALRYAWVLLLLALGLMSKSMVVTLPFVFLLLDAWPLERLRKEGLRRLVLEKLPHFALVLAVCLVTLYTQREGGAVSQELPFLDRLLHAPRAVGHYLLTSFYPVGLCVFYPHPSLSPDSGQPLLGIVLGLAVCGISVAVWRLRGRLPELFLGWFWFLGTLVPVLGLVQVGDQAWADRYTYLPGIGLLIALLSLPRVVPLPRPAWLGLCAAALLAANLTAYRQVAFWKNTETLWRRALAVTERNATAHVNLGQVLGNSTRYDEAEEHFRTTLELEPDSYLALVNLGFLCLKTDRHDEARELLERAVEVEPDHYQGHLYLAMTFLMLEDWDGARASFGRAREVEPRVEEHKYYRAGMNHLLDKP